MGGKQCRANPIVGYILTKKKSDPPTEPQRAFYSPVQESLAKWFPFEAQVFFPVDVDTTHTGNNMFVIPTRNITLV